MRVRTLVARLSLICVLVIHDSGVMGLNNIFGVHDLDVEHYSASTMKDTSVAVTTITPPPSEATTRSTSKEPDGKDHGLSLWKTDVRGLRPGEVIMGRYVVVERLGSYGEPVMNYEVPLPWFVPLLEERSVDGKGGKGVEMHKSKVSQSPSLKRRVPRRRRIQRPLLSYEPVELLEGPPSDDRRDRLSHQEVCLNPQILVDRYQRRYIDAPPLDDNTIVEPAAQRSPFVRGQTQRYTWSLPSPTREHGEEEGNEVRSTARTRVNRNRGGEDGRDSDTPGWEERNYRMYSTTPLGRGSFGEVWRAKPLVSINYEEMGIDVENEEDEWENASDFEFESELGETRDVVLKRLFALSTRNRTKNHAGGQREESEDEQRQGLGGIDVQADGEESRTHGSSSRRTVMTDIDLGRMSGLREAYFGTIMRGAPHVTRFIEVFEGRGDISASAPHVDNDVGDGTHNSTHTDPLWSFDGRLPPAYNNSRDGPGVSHGEADTSQGGDTSESRNDLWLAFLFEGYPLSQTMFRVETPNEGEQSGGCAIVTQSALWWYMKRSVIGNRLLKDLIYQLLFALNETHKRGIVHRDVKMENIFLAGNTWTLRLGDWGSAIQEQYSIDADIMRALRLNSLYPSDFPPSTNEETMGYQPPEVTFFDTSSISSSTPPPTEERQGAPPSESELMFRTPPYDMWGVGVVFLQLVLGSKDVFTVANNRKRARLERYLEKEPQNVQREMLLLHTFADLCLTPLPSAPSAKPSTVIRSNATSAHVHPPNSSADDGSAEQNGIRNPSPGRVNTQYPRSVWEKLRRMRQQQKRLARASSGDTIGSPEETNESDYDQHMGHDYIEHEIHRENQNSGSHVLFGSAPANVGCTDEEFAAVLRERDPSAIGLDNPHARDLLRSLLAFHPEERISAKEALAHPWFSGDTNPSASN